MPDTEKRKSSKKGGLIGFGEIQEVGGMSVGVPMVVEYSGLEMA